MEPPDPTPVVLADDTTGALEAGAFLVQAGWRTRVLLGARPLPARFGAVLDLGTRHLGAAGAYARTMEAAHLLQERHAVYLKTDSTLRGEIRAGLQALRATWPQRPIAYVPAYPRLGRTVRDGMLRVDGVPVSETAFARDPLNPVLTSSVRELVAGVAGVEIYDAETEEELDAIGRQLEHGDCLVAGPAGFLSRWRRSFAQTVTTPVARPPVQRWLVVCGSLHPRSRAQAAAAEQLGLPVVRTADVHERHALARLLKQLPAADGLIVFGGDTVRAILESRDVTELTALGEVLPGVPLSVTPGGLVLVTKAGGFGPENVVQCILEQWH